jgi:hypothetical protein
MVLSEEFCHMNAFYFTFIISVFLQCSIMITLYLQEMWEPLLPPQNSNSRCSNKIYGEKCNDTNRSSHL